MASNHCNRLSRVLFATCFTLLAFSSLLVEPTRGAAGDPYCSLYLPIHKITTRTLDEIVHYANLTPINAVVLHVKTPRGELAWPAKNTLANELGVAARTAHLAHHIERLRRDQVHSIAKLDVFADHRLATQKPALGIEDRSTGGSWVDANGLAWSNPTDRRVWDYNIALAVELAQLGIDEIQFDYVRFPSDGDLGRIHYPNAPSDFSKADTIAAFLARAYSALKPFEVTVSADIFGLTAWKTDDFGVGQVLEKMSPHLDVICPMLYPSHFPAGFLGKQSPGDFPQIIMEASVRSMMHRTDKPVRPWVQGFWYNADQIAEQLDGIMKADGRSWAIWNPAGRYGVSYRALEQHVGQLFPKPSFYPNVALLREKSDKHVRGHSAVVNYTDYAAGFSILSLEASGSGSPSKYRTPAAMLTTLDEGIMDHILAKRMVGFDADADPYVKRKKLVDLMCTDIDKDPRRMRPDRPIYVDWSGDCVFTISEIPRQRLDAFAQAGRDREHRESASNAGTTRLDVAAVAPSLLPEAIIAR